MRYLCCGSVRVAEIPTLEKELFTRFKVHSEYPLSPYWSLLVVHTGSGLTSFFLHRTGFDSNVYLHLD